MAASAVLTSSGSVVLGGVGVGKFPERRPSPCSNAVSAYGIFLPELRLKTCVRLRQPPYASGRRHGRNWQKIYAIVSQQGDVDEEDNSKVFKSMKDVERRKEDTFGALGDVDLARVIADTEVYNSSSSVGTRNKTMQPPRFATLRAFGEAGGEGVVTGFGGTSVFELLAASVEATKQVRNWEVLSGRLAMLALSTAIGVEFFTGTSVFEGVNLPELQGAAALCAVAAVSAATFAYAWRAKADVVSLMSKNYKNMVDSALDNLIDGLFFDESNEEPRFGVVFMESTEPVLAEPEFSTLDSSSDVESTTHCFEAVVQCENYYEKQLKEDSETGDTMDVLGGERKQVLVVVQILDWAAAFKLWLKF